MGSKGRPYRTVEIDGFTVLVGKSDEDNDVLTFEVAEPQDVWMHVAGHSGSHVVIRNPERLPAVPEPVLRRAAELAAWFSKGRPAKRVEVHVCRAGDVSKPRGFPAGKVLLARWTRLRVEPRGPASAADDLDA
jgi:predicted ribosome quality control (RQC) complex YloA/Tae2 family protein